jgi:hypothetical protein
VGWILEGFVMRRLSIAFVALALLVAFPTAAMAQRDSSQLANLREQIVSAIKNNKPDWKYEPVTPISANDGVILQQWTLNDKSVRIAILSHKSADEAAKALPQIVRDGPVKEVLQGFGDEGFSWGRGTVSFRRKDLTVHTSAVITDPNVDLEGLAKHVGDEQKLSKEFLHLREGVPLARKDQVISQRKMPTPPFRCLRRLSGGATSAKGRA